jgi:hypothetical protein
MFRYGATPPSWSRFAGTSRRIGATCFRVGSDVAVIGGRFHILPPMPSFVRLAGTVSAALGITVAAATVAVANIDPASDVLLQQDTFVTYDPVCNQLKAALKASTKEVRASGYPVKVAVIAASSDLGGAPEYFDHPSAYAKFLGSELATVSSHANRKVTGLHLLVVMPAGLAFFGGTPEANDVTSRISTPEHFDANALTRVAIKAVPQIATAAGHPTPPVKIASGCSHSTNALVLFVVPIALLVVAGLAIRFAQRDRKAPAPRP